MEFISRSIVPFLFKIRNFLILEIESRTPTPPSDVKKRPHHHSTSLAMPLRATAAQLSNVSAGLLLCCVGSAFLGHVLTVWLSNSDFGTADRRDSNPKHETKGGGDGKGTQRARTRSKSDSSDSLSHRPYQHEERMARRIANASREDKDSLPITDLRPRDSVTVRVPATSANIGSGYDCLGMCVDLWTEVTVERSDKFEILCTGEGADMMPLDETNLLCVGVKAAFDRANSTVPTLKYTVKSRIPYARGLGSSSAAIVAGIIAGLVLAGQELEVWGQETLLQIAAEIEGHPDNVAPAIYGGMQLGIHTSERWLSERISMPPGLQLIIFIPDFIGKTSTARGVLPDEVSRSDCSFNIGRTAYLINALNQGNIENMKFGTQDKIHQPQRGEKVS